MSKAVDHDPSPAGPEITRLLVRWADGDVIAGDTLLQLVYDQLHTRARRLARSGSDALELQPTELIAEAWLKLDKAALGSMHRQHFLALSAKAMRQIMVDHARRRMADKRGGGWMRLTLSHAGADPAAASFELLALDEAMNQLAEIHPRAALAIELHYFGGLTDAESAIHLDVTQRTIERDLRSGRAWLKDHLSAT